MAVMTFFTLCLVLLWLVAPGWCTSEQFSWLGLMPMQVCCAVLYCAALCGAVLCCAVLYCAAPCHTMLRPATLYCALPYCAVLCCVVLGLCCAVLCCGCAVPCLAVLCSAWAGLCCAVLSEVLQCVDLLYFRLDLLRKALSSLPGADAKLMSYVGE